MVQRNYARTTSTESGTDAGLTRDLSTTVGTGTLQSQNVNDTVFQIAQRWQRTVGAGVLLDGSGTWNGQVDVNSEDGNDIGLRFRFQRINSSGVVQSSSAYSTESTTTGIKTLSTTWNPGTWATGDRLALTVEIYRITGHGNVTFTAGIPNTYIDAPEAASPIVQAVGTLAETDSLVTATPQQPIVVNVGTLAETETPQGVAVIHPQVISVETIAETETLNTIDQPADVRATQLLVETLSTDPDVRATQLLVESLSTDLGVRATQLIVETLYIEPLPGAVETLAETDTLLPIQVSQEQSIAVGTLAETESLETIDAGPAFDSGFDDGFMIGASQVIAVEALAETDSLIDIQLSGDQNIAVGTVAETDSLQTIPPQQPIVVAVGTLAETDSLVSVTPSQPTIQAVGTLTETNTLLYAPPCGVLLNDTFTGTNGDPWDSNLWQMETITGESTIEIQNNRGEVTLDADSFEADPFAFASAKIPDLADVEIRGTIRLKTFQAGTESGSLEFRVRNSGSGSIGLRFLAFNDNIIVARNGSTLDTIAGPTRTNDMDFRFRVVGNQIRAKVWASSGSEPGTWDSEVTDSVVTGPEGVWITAFYFGDPLETETPVAWEIDDLIVESICVDDRVGTIAETNTLLGVQPLNFPIGTISETETLNPLSTPSIGSIPETETLWSVGTFDGQVTFEYPGHVGPFVRTANGALYAALPGSVSNDQLEIWKQPEGGSWSSIGSVINPFTTDGTTVRHIIGKVDGDTLHIGWQAQADPFHMRLVYAQVDLSTDTIGTAEIAHSGTTNVNTNTGPTAMGIRSDDTVILAYRDPNALDLYVTRRTGVNTWSTPQLIEGANIQTSIAGVMVGDDFHIFYLGTGTVGSSHRVYRSNNTVSSLDQVNSQGLTGNDLPGYAAEGDGRFFYSQNVGNSTPSSAAFYHSDGQAENETWNANTLSTDVDKPSNGVSVGVVGEANRVHALWVDASDGFIHYQEWDYDTNSWNSEQTTSVSIPDGDLINFAGYVDTSNDLHLAGFYGASLSAATYWDINVGASAAPIAPISETDSLISIEAFQGVVPVGTISETDTLITIASVITEIANVSTDIILTIGMTAGLTTVGAKPIVPIGKVGTTSGTGNWGPKSYNPNRRVVRR